MTSILLRGLCLAAVLMAGSCAAPTDDAKRHVRRSATVNHPIPVEPSYQSMKVYYLARRPASRPPTRRASTPSSSDYQAHGNGSIVISAPAGIARQRQVIGYLADRINEMGVSAAIRSWSPAMTRRRATCRSSSIMSPTRPTPTPCGDWSEDLAYTDGQHDRPRISAAPCSRISPPWSPIRAICWARARWTTRDADRRADRDHQLRGGHILPRRPRSADQSGAISDVGRSRTDHDQAIETSRRDVRRRAA